MKTSLFGHQRIDGVVPGIRGQRSFPTQAIAHADPFVLLDHIGPQVMPADFKVEGAPHPHRGFETITFMFAGNLHHKDNLGGDIVLSSGGVQRMNAGSGISHGGDMWGDESSGEFHEIQLWVNSPKAQKMSAPTIDNIKAEDIPSISKGGIHLRVIAGEQTDAEGKLVQGPIKTFANISAFHGQAAKEGEIEIQIPLAHDRILLYVLKGSVNLEGQKAVAYQSLVLKEAGERIKLSDVSGEFLLLTGQSLNEPMVMGGPFVMNSQAEIDQAYADYQAGHFS
ncbi:MAG: pirin family protein [Oleispira sp.]|nr:pirin family protein [Oleispira sp.]MBL4882001.1 pirin family protein [Oleispira sp.]